MLLRHSTRIMEDNTLLTTLSETESAQWAADLSPEEIEQAIMHEWSLLQQVSSYVERLLEANRGLIESIATQN